jgi:competence ComEA-like helix-hairpin-helix protein
LIPSAGVIPNAATTQPMSIPRSGGLPNPARPPVPPVPAPRSTQRLVLAGGSKTASLKPTPSTGGSINLPIGMILRCLPPEVLAAPLAEFENSGAAATEVALPLNAILKQIPSGRIEMTLQEIVAHLPPGFLQPAETMASHLPALIGLPLMDVVMRIPPDLLSVRSDQKEVDASVAQMADPFTEEVLREQAESARRAQGHAKIVDESQVAPAEEFVPQAVAMSNRAIVPPPRTTSLPVVSPPVPKIPAFPPPSSPENRAPTLPLRAPEAAPTPPPAAPEAPARPSLLSASQSLSAAQAAPRTPSLRPPTSAIPGFFSAKSPASSGPLTPGQSGLILPRPPSPLPQPEATAPLPPPVGISPSEIPATPEEATRTVPLPPDSNADDLQRLAALAMAQIGDEPDETEPAPAEPPVDPAGVTLPIFPPPEPIYAATARLQLPEVPVQEPSQPAPVVPLDEPIRLPNRPELSRRGITAPVPLEPEAPARPAEESRPETPSEAASADASAVAINLNSCTAEDLLQIPAVNAELAAAIVQHRAKIGEFRKLEDLLDVPGMTAAVYHALTGETVPMGTHQSLNDLLGFPPEQKVSLKDVTDRISCWPDVTGCLLSQNSGLVLVGNVPAPLDKKAIVAFAPRMFEELNKSFSEMAGRQTDDLVIPTTGTSFHILRDKDLYLTILCRVPQMPERHLKIARYVLAALSVRPS